ncbi:MAG: ComEC/Rec2 family competence protein, partial [Sinomicrobium sp.]|nr:ComEC/Rec2 family competence protein [Sinomicrobium sp.]
IADFFWKITTVTLAAQCGVAPLSLYYFHQFPGLFFVSNLVIIPVLGIILGLGILVIVLALLHGLPSWLGVAYGFIIRQMNHLVQWVAAREAFVFRDISFDGALLLMVYSVLVSGIRMLKKPGFYRVALFLTAVLALQATLLVNRYTTATTRRFIVFHKNGDTVIGQQEGAAMTLYASGEKWLDDALIKNYTTAERVRQIRKNELRNVYTVGEKTLLRIDSLGIYRVPRMPSAFVLLCNAPRINLDRLIAEINPAIIIADGSNSKSYIQRWRASCKAKNIPFHATAGEGAFIIED